MLDGIADVAWWVPVLLCLAALLAGWVDAVVGGGGLIQLPALLLVPGFAPVHALATNKVGSVMGTLTSATTYYRRVRPDLHTTLPVAGVAFLGSMGGAGPTTRSTRHRPGSSWPAPSPSGRSSASTTG